MKHSRLTVSVDRFALTASRQPADSVAFKCRGDNGNFAAMPRVAGARSGIALPRRGRHAAARLIIPS